MHRTHPLEQGCIHVQAKCLRKGSGYFAPSLPLAPLSLLIHIHASYPVGTVMEIIITIPSGCNTISHSLAY